MAVNTHLLGAADKLMMVTILGGHVADGGEVGRDRKSDDKAKTAPLAGALLGLAKTRN